MSSRRAKRKHKKTKRTGNSPESPAVPESPTGSESPAGPESALPPKTPLLHGWLVYLGLALATLVVYWQVHDFQFTNWDDGLFVSENSFVTGGLTGENVAWSVGIHGPGQWHPIAWWAHQLNCQLFGLQPGAHHLVNVLLHVAVALVLLTALWHLTNRFWPSALVAALHALHPLSVESVAWVSHLREPLSMLFWALVMWAYAVYARRGGLQRYLLVLLLFAMGLMAKPTLVTLPCVLLLLDWWPLKRLTWGPSSTDEAQTHRPLSVLVLEKLPLLGLAGISIWLAYLCQRSMGSVVSLEVLPWSERLANAAQSYALYLRNMVWPLNLATAYPLPESFHPLMVAGAVLLLVAISAAVWRFRFQRKYLLVGWLWYLGTLVPVIGLVRMGSPTAMPDHYMYVSLIGIYIAIAWLLAEWVQRRPATKSIVIGGVAVVLLLLLPLTWRQIAFWRDSETLWQRSLAVSNDNSLAHNNLGSVLQALGRPQEALEHAQEALRLKPNYDNAHTNCGIALKALGRPREAIAHYQKALQINPDSANTHYNLANLLVAFNQPQEAAQHYKDTLRLKPNFAEAHNNYGAVLQRLGRPSESLPHFQDALRVKPNFVDAHANWGHSLRILGRPQEAIEHYQEALRLKPEYALVQFNYGESLRMLNRSQEAIPYYQETLRIEPNHIDAHNNLGNILQVSGRLEDAVTHYLEALRIKPDIFQVNYNCGVALQALRRPKESLERFEQALRLKPNSAEVHHRLAWVLATSPDEAVRNGKRAVEYAKRAVELVSSEHSILFDALAAAHAESGQFAEAVKWQEKAVELATGNLKDTLSARLKLYRQDQPYRDSN